MSEYFENNDEETLRKIRLNETGKPIKMFYIFFLIDAVASIVIGIAIGLFAEDTFLTLVYIFAGLASATMFVFISIALNMFYEIHFIITHIDDVYLSIDDE